MSTTTVLFEEVEPFKALNFPVTFQAVIDHPGHKVPDHVLLWTVDRYEAQGATAGLVMAGFAVIAGIIDLIRSRGPRLPKPAWLRLAGAVLAIGLSVVNAFVHSRDAYTSVVPTGIILSGLVVFVVLVTGCLRWSMMRPSEIGAMG